MLVIPAVDIKGGKAVRLVQGKADQETVYYQDPLDAAKRWRDLGARRIHIVDLDGAFEGRPRNVALTLKLLERLTDVELEIGGGLRTAEAVAELLDAGAARCVIGTKAIEDPAFVADLARSYPGRISVGLDAKDGYVAVKGWVEVSGRLAVDVAGELAPLPLGEVIYTDIERDGMLEGPNFSRLAEMQTASKHPVIASGGVTDLEQVRRLREMGVYGCIIGKALFDGRMALPDALQTAAG
jgi:phosphoribosylformimino-5-aminoimidazole carboxamide ribotide isomerase